MKLGRRDDSVALLQSDVAAAEKVLGASHPLIMPICLAMARAHLDFGESKEAMQWAGRALLLSKKHFGANNPATATCVTLQAVCLVMQGQLQEASKRFTQARDNKLLAGWHAGSASVCDDMEGYACVLGTSGRYAAALELLQNIVEARTEYAEQGHARSAASMTVDGLRVRFLTEQVSKSVLAAYAHTIQWCVMS
jgi:hypothetical protein